MIAPHPDPLPATVAPEPAPPPVRPEEAVELVWFDPEIAPRVRRHPSFRPLLDALERAPLDPDFDDPAFAREPMLIEDRREVFEILAHAAPTSAEGLEALLARCVRDDGKFVPALALFAGEMDLPFDELAALRATLTTVAPLVGPDEALKSAVQAAKDFLATPGLLSAPAVAEGLTKRIEDAFAQGKRVVPPGYLEAQRERALLEQRQYQRRAVFGGKHLRGLVKLEGAEPASAARSGGPGRSAGARRRARPRVPAREPGGRAADVSPVPGADGGGDPPGGGSLRDPPGCAARAGAGAKRGAAEGVIAVPTPRRSGRPWAATALRRSRSGAAPAGAGRGPGACRGRSLRR